MQAWLEASRDFRKLAKLTFVRLDRTVIAIDSQGDELRDESSPRSARLRATVGGGAAKDPLDLVFEATRERYFAFRRQLTTIRYDAYRSLMRLHFNPIKPTKKKANIVDLEKKLGVLRTRVAKSQFAKEIPDTQGFFDSLDSLLKQAKQPATRKAGRKTLAEESLQFMLEISEQQIEGLIRIFEDEQRRASTAELELKTYIDALERFLAESGKRLWFSEERLELAFYVPAIGEKPEGLGRSLKTLSSGERQVVIVLTYLAFLSGPNSVFIIDEPELSLHLRWQGYLMTALKTLRPKGGQIIMATHAPEIVGRATGSSIQLRQSYMPELKRWTMKSDAPAYTVDGLVGFGIIQSEWAYSVFFCEDAGFESVYERFFRRLVPDLKKFAVACTGGKSISVKVCRRKDEIPIPSIFLVDKDYDDILGTFRDCDELGMFYLRRYSFENYLCQIGALTEVVLEVLAIVSAAVSKRDVELRIAGYRAYERILTDRLIEISRYFVVARKNRLQVKTSKTSAVELFPDSSDVAPMAGDWFAAFKNAFFERLTIEQSWIVENDDLTRQLTEAFVSESNVWGDLADGDHIVGKHFLFGLLTYLDAHLNTNLRGMESRELHLRLLNHVSFDDLWFLKNAICGKLQGTSALRVGQTLSQTTAVA